MKSVVKKVLSALTTVIMAGSICACSGASKQADNTQQSDNTQQADVDYTTLSTEELKEMAKKESGEITFSIWWGEEYWQSVAQDFEKKYGIKVNLAYGETAPLLDKLIMEKDSDKASVDVVVIGGSNTKTVMDANLMYPNLLNAIDNKDDLDEGLSKVQEGVVHNGTLVPLYLNQTGFLYNPEKVKEEDLPQTWEEFEKWIDENPMKFAFNEPSKGGSGQSFVHTVINCVAGGLDKYSGDTEVDESKIKDWDKVWQWINDRKDKITITTSNSDSIAKVNSGECYMAAAWDDDSYKSMQKGELFKEAKIYIPEFGMAGGGDTVGIVNNSANKASAILFVKELVSEEGQKSLNEKVGSMPALTTVNNGATLLSNEDMQYRLSWFPAAYKQRMNDDFIEEVLMK